MTILSNEKKNIQDEASSIIIDTFFYVIFKLWLCTQLKLIFLSSY